MTGTQIEDTDRSVIIHSQETVYNGAIWNLQRDTFQMEPTEPSLTREYIAHPGAVAVVALDHQQRVALIQQYRHPVRQDCWEIPAGLCDDSQETRLATAQRELAEETDLTAQQWSVLVDHHPSAGSSAETIRIFLAQNIGKVPRNQRHDRTDEESHIVLRWVPLKEALQAVLAGHIKNVNAVAGIMATYITLSNSEAAHSSQ